MLNFKSFLKEELLTEQLLLEKAETSTLEADDKGKLHELLLAKHLHPNTQLPEHHRSFSENEDHAGTPEQVHDRLKAKVGPAAYAELDRHAKQSADAFKQSLKDQGHIGDHAHIGNVHWTSNADKPNSVGDHEKTVGVKDVNSNADLIVTLHDKQGNIVGHHGISAKYGSQEPNYRNPGVDSLEKIAKLPSGSLLAHMKNHNDAMEKLGYGGSADQRNVQTKIDEMHIDEIRQKHAEGESVLASGKTMSKKKALMHEHLGKFIQAHDSLGSEKKKEEFRNQAKHRAELARSSNLAARTTMMQSFSSGLAKHSDEELRNVVRQNVSPSTHIPHTIVHSKVKDSGDADSIIKPMHSLADEHLSQFEPGSLHVVPGKGTTMAIKGKNINTGKISGVARYTIKSSSGAHKGAVGGFRLK